MRRFTHFFLQIIFLLIGFGSSIYLVLNWGPYIFRQPLFLSLTSKSNKKVLEVPRAIRFPTLDMGQKIKPAGVVGNQWDTYEDAVSWLNTSAMLKSGGNIVLFGHNKKHLLGKMRDLQVGDPIVLTAGLDTKSYRVTQKIEVEPQELKYVLNREDRLTIYTCSGPFDSLRLFVIAVPFLET